MTWLWQFDGQCSIVSVQEKADGGRGPSSVAVPEKLMVSPTLQVSVEAGVWIVACGGVDAVGRDVWIVVALWLVESSVHLGVEQQRREEVKRRLRLRKVDVLAVTRAPAVVERGEERDLLHEPLEQRPQLAA